MMRFRWIPVVFLVLVVPLYSMAAPGLITVSGQAQVNIPTDRLKVQFRLSTEGESFSAALDEAGRVLDLIRETLKTERQGPVLVESQVLVLAQKKITWGSKTKKLNHRLTLTVGDVEEGLTDLAMRIVDQVLALDPELELFEVRGELSESKRAAVEKALLADAMEDARQSAEELAARAGLRLLPPAAILPEGSWQARRGDSYLRESVSVVSFAPGIRVSTDLVGTVEVSLGLDVEYPTATR